MKQTFAKSMVPATIILMDILSGMEFDLFVPSFPELQSQFSLSPFWVESLLSVNFAGYCLSLFFVGGLADHYGRKPMILLGLMTFIMGSLLCLVPSYTFLLSGRFLQGVGIAAPAILSFLIIADAYPLKQQQSFFAILNGLLNFSAGAAPVLGSYITLYFHWQGNFMTNQGHFVDFKRPFEEGSYSVSEDLKKFMQNRKYVENPQVSIPLKESVTSSDNQERWSSKGSYNKNGTQGSN